MTKRLRLAAMTLVTMLVAGLFTLVTAATAPAPPAEAKPGSIWACAIQAGSVNQVGGSASGSSTTYCWGGSRPSMRIQTNLQAFNYTCYCWRTVKRGEYLYTKGIRTTGAVNTIHKSSVSTSCVRSGPLRLTRIGAKIYVTGREATVWYATDIGPNKTIQCRFRV